MTLRPARVARRGVIGRPVARTAAVVGTAAVVAHAGSLRTAKILAGVGLPDGLGGIGRY